MKTPEEIKAYKKQWWDKNRERLLTYKKEWRLKRKLAAFEKFGSKCGRCGFDDLRALQVDHVNGGGVKENRKDRDSGFYVKVLNDTTGKYQLLCANCNWIKRHENGEYRYYGN